MKNLFIICALSFAIFSIQSCSTETKKEVSTEVTTEKSEAVANYECPMKCEGKKFTEPGICPVCEMDLEKVE
ncbi:MAG: hypothetical protein A2033_18430 [Bacteroidetes bacterium GWA2_31_9]|nr:MAG: hypothetical protein A2033_18430 [Bacteroidetes bacterium GWA2_31_9]